MEKPEEIIGLLVRSVASPSSREGVVRQFLTWYDKAGLPTEVPIRADIMDIFTELAVDLSYYEPDPLKRAQDPSFFGDDGLVKEIEVALRRLSQIGIAIPSL